MSGKTTEIRFVVWQFVRLMVKLEEMVNSGVNGPEKKLYDSWEDIWVDLDARLIDLGRNNPEAFAELMMDQEVVSDLTASEAKIVAKIFRKVVDEIVAQLKKTEVDEDVEDLTFERDELTILVNELKTIANAFGA